MSAVHWECWIDAGRAAFERLGRAVVTTRARVAETYTIGTPASGDTIVILLSASPEEARRFAEIAKARGLRYQSPTRLDGSTLRPIYGSAEAEIAARATP